jgi:Calpain family cysteine protease
MGSNNNDVIILLDDDDNDDDYNDSNGSLSVMTIEKNESHHMAEELSNETIASTAFFLPHEQNAINMIKEVLNIQQQQNKCYNNTTIDHMIFKKIQNFSWNIENTIDYYLTKQQHYNQNHLAQNGNTCFMDCFFSGGKGLILKTINHEQIFTKQDEKEPAVHNCNEKVPNQFVKSKTLLSSSPSTCLVNDDIVSNSSRNSNNNNGIGNNWKERSTTSDSSSNINFVNKYDASNANPTLKDDGTVRPVSKYFIDPDFPPDTSSLDGRQRAIDKCTNYTINNTMGSNNNDNTHSTVAATANASVNTVVTYCHCGFVAAAKRVQSDGPNYGRFYLSCGQTSSSFLKGRQQVQQQQKKQGQSDNKNDNQPITTFISTPSKRRRRAPVVVIRKDSPALVMKNRSNDGNKNSSDNNGTSAKKALFTSNNSIEQTTLVTNYHVPTTKLPIVNPYSKKKDTNSISFLPSQTTTVSDNCVIDSTNVSSSSIRTIVVASSSSNPKTSPVSPPQQWKEPCKFFQWDNDGSKGAINTNKGDDINNDINNNTNSGYSINNRKRKISWYHFGIENACTLYKDTINVDHIRQGSVGNCWFLSALSVVAEKTWLVDKIIQDCSGDQSLGNTNATSMASNSSQRQLNDYGIYKINLCIDGKWQSIVIDSYLPVVIESNYEELHGNRNHLKSSSPTSKKKRPKKLRLDIRNIGSGVRVVDHGMNTTESISGLSKSNRKQHHIVDELVMAFPAFCGTPKRQLWPALIEKAYAKVHGSYAQLSAGFIKEGLQDLTGAPTETIIFHQYYNSITHSESLWQQLLSYNKAGFVMGIATSVGGQGLVGGHAYSVLDVIQITDTVIGEQSKLTDYFSRSSNSLKQSEVEIVDVHKTSAETSMDNIIRIVRIRNPWGEREWKGDWSYNSERWTTALRAKIGIDKSYAKNDGTFFMSYDDMIHKFHHMDVAKTRQVSTAKNTLIMQLIFLNEAFVTYI